MSRPIARTLGALALAAALATSSTAAFAATPSVDPAFRVAKKQVTTVAGLSLELRTSAVQKAQSRPGAPRLTGQGTSENQNPETTDSYLDAFCGNDWFITWDETASGDPILGTFTLHCGGASAPIG
jgi:hypothetical protein